MSCHIRLRVREVIGERAAINLTLKQINTLDDTVRGILTREKYLKPKSNSHNEISSALDKYFSEKGTNNEISKYFQDFCNSSAIQKQGNGGPPGIAAPYQRKPTLKELLGDEHLLIEQGVLQ